MIPRHGAHARTHTHHLLLVLDDSLLANVDTVQEFSDILVLDVGGTLDGGGGLGDVLDIIAHQQ